MTKSDDKRVPVLRFKGFTDEWEQRKLGDVLEKFQKRINPEKENIPLWSLTVKDGLIPKNAQYNRSFLVKKNDFFNLLPDNYLIYNPMNITLGAIDINNSGKKIAVSGYYIILKIKSNYNEEFVLNNLVSRKSINLYQRFSTGSLTEKQRLQYPAFSKIKKLFPDFTEQRKIGSLLSALNKQITLQQRKLELLQLIEKSLLGTVLNEASSKVNFRLESSNWKKVALKDMIKVSNKKNKENKYDKFDVLSVSREVGVVNQIKYQGRSFASTNLENYKIVCPNDLIYTKSPLKNAPYGIFKISKSYGIVSPLYAIYKATNSEINEYISLLFKSDNIVTHFLAPLVTKGAKNTINVSDSSILKGYIQLPSSKVQKKIVQLFSELQSNISLIDNKISYFEKFKQFLLQNMFI